MSKRHLKSIAAPKSWPIKRKENIFIIRQNPGAHKLEDSMAVGLVLKLLSQVKNTREAKQIVNQRKVLINKKPVKDIKSQAGLFDVVEFTDNYYRIILNKNGILIFVEIKEPESKISLHKITKKTKVNGNKMQLNFHDGFNMLIGKNDYKTNDVIVMEGDQIKDRINFERGNLVYITRGSNVGMIARIEEMHEKPPFNKYVTISIADKKINIAKDCVFLVGKTKPVITLSEK